MKRIVRQLLGGLVIASTAVAGACVPEYAGKVHDVVVEANYGYGLAIDEHGLPETLALDLFTPTDGTPGDPASRPARTAVVLVHSGGFTTGHRREMERLARSLAERGYVVASISYRVREGRFFWFTNPSAETWAAITDARHDAQAAVRWLRSYAGPLGIDPAAIAVAGYSAGAITAVGVAQHAEDPGLSGTPDVDSSVCLAVSISGFGASNEHGAEDAPVLLLHGADDNIVAPLYAQRTAMHAASVGRLVGYVEYPGAGHALLYQRFGYLVHEIDTALTARC